MLRVLTDSAAVFFSARRYHPYAFLCFRFHFIYSFVQCRRKRLNRQFAPEPRLMPSTRSFYDGHREESNIKVCAVLLTILTISLLLHHKLWQWRQCNNNSITKSWGMIEVSAGEHCVVTWMPVSQSPMATSREAFAGDRHAQPPRRPEMFATYISTNNSFNSMKIMSFLLTNSESTDRM